MKNDDEEIQHSWCRFWYLRGDNEVRSMWEGIHIPSRPDDRTNLFELDQLFTIPCLILLGDAGLGKSTIIDEYQRKKY
ncbi:hypothetical protein CG775_08660 [Paenibacillus polymyxa]|nr:hypothetical protein CG775_08660 [Paenibacillus polymyxa]